MWGDICSLLPQGPRCPDWCTDVKLCGHLSLGLETIASWVDFHLSLPLLCKPRKDTLLWYRWKNLFQRGCVFSFQATEGKSNTWRGLVREPTGRRGTRGKPLPQWLMPTGFRPALWWQDFFRAREVMANKLKIRPYLKMANPKSPPPNTAPSLKMDVGGLQRSPGCSCQCRPAPECLHRLGNCAH